MTITKTYNVGNLMEDLKGLYKIAGLKGQPVAFIFTCALCPGSKRPKVLLLAPPD